MTDIKQIKPQSLRQVKPEMEDSELEGYLFSIAHDLKIPLISISGHLNRLEKIIGKSVPENARDCLYFIKKSATHMNDLLDDLFELAQIGKVDEELSEIKTGKLVFEIINELRQTPNGDKTAFVVESDLPDIIFNKKRAYQVFLNVIGNAVKFSRNTDGAKIIIGFENDEIFIKDNGPGIDPCYHEEIFKIFTRLNADGVEGTGIGLPTARKILKSLGGSIRVESALQNGATFYIKLSVVKNKDSFSLEMDSTTLPHKLNQRNKRRKLKLKAKPIPVDTVG